MGRKNNERFVSKERRSGICKYYTTAQDIWTKHFTELYNDESR
jgi:hypothetical protein